MLKSPSSDVEVALLDFDGRIVCVNDAWSRFCAENGGDTTRCGVGVSYLDVCDRAGDDTMAAQVAASVRVALSGALPAPLAIDVPCHSTGELRWFDVLVSSRLADDGTCLGATVTLSPARVVSRTPGPGPTPPPDPAPAATGWPQGDHAAERLGDGVAHALFAVAPCAVLLADDDGRIVAANAQADALFGTGARGLVGQPLERLLPPHWRGGDEPGPAGGPPHWADPPYSGRVAVGARPDGSYLRVQIASAPVPLSYGTGVLVTASALDREPVSATVGTLLVDLDVVLRRIFSAGLTLTGVRERLERDGVPARTLTQAIADLDLATRELRHAARHQQSSSRPGTVGSDRSAPTLGSDSRRAARAPDEEVQMGPDPEDTDPVGRDADDRAGGRLDDAVDEMVDESFPASDPPSGWAGEDPRDVSGGPA